VEYWQCFPFSRPPGGLVDALGQGRPDCEDGQAERPAAGRPTSSLPAVGRDSAVQQGHRPGSPPLGARAAAEPPLRRRVLPLVVHANALVPVIERPTMRDCIVSVPS